MNTKWLTSILIVILQDLQYQYITGIFHRLAQLLWHNPRSAPLPCPPIILLKIFPLNTIVEHHFISVRPTQSFNIRLNISRTFVRCLHCRLIWKPAKKYDLVWFSFYYIISIQELKSIIKNKRFIQKDGKDVRYNVFSIYTASTSLKFLCCI